MLNTKPFQKQKQDRIGLLPHIYVRTRQISELAKRT